MPPKSAGIFFKSESRYRMLVENSCDVIFSLDMGGNFAYISPAWQKLLGHEPSEVLGHNFREFIHPDDQAGVAETIAGAVRSGEVGEYTYRIMRADGSWRWHTSRGTRHIDEDGVLTIIAIGHGLNMELVAEGECGVIQGFYYSRPLTAEEFALFCRDWEIF